MLVPRELHVVGDHAYFEEKIDACLKAGIITESSDYGQRFLALTGKSPFALYPDGVIRNYPAGLELARERLDRDNARLRESGFNVRKLIPSIANDPQGTAFKALVDSMREHGFMRQFPIVEYDDGAIIDGLARYRAAETLQLDVKFLTSDYDRKMIKRRDTPLNRVLVAIDSNIARLQGDVVDAVHGRVADVTLRPWDETSADLALTQEWRRSIGADYAPRFDVELLAYRPGDEATIQVTADHKVMVRSLVVAAGLSQYKFKSQGVADHVPLEQARTPYSGRKADFALAEDLIAGIEEMQQERRDANRKVDPQWEQIRSWLLQNFGPRRGRREG
jgi:hypothetical protein